MRRSTMTTDTPPAVKKSRSLLRDMLRWALAVVIIVFLVQRLAHDWPTVRDSFDHLAWSWLAVGAIPGIGYFFFRIIAWQRALESVGVRAGYWPVGTVWMNGEIIRYIPGNVWSVVGRVAMAPRLGAERVAVFSSMVLEALALIVTAAGLSALMLIGYPDYLFTGRGALLVLAAFLCMLVGVRTVTQRLVALVYRMVRKKDRIPATSGIGRAFVWMSLAWLVFAAFQVCTVKALGLPLYDPTDVVVLAGVFLLSWLVGYLSFITPSGLGVREAVLAFLLAPFMGAGEAILLAVVSRVVMIIIEVVALGIVNAVGRMRTQAPQPS